MYDIERKKYMKYLHAVQSGPRPGLQSNTMPLLFEGKFINHIGNQALIKKAMDVVVGGV